MKAVKFKCIASFKSGIKAYGEAVVVVLLDSKVWWLSPVGNIACFKLSRCFSFTI